MIPGWHVLITVWWQTQTSSWSCHIYSSFELCYWWMMVSTAPCTCLSSRTFIAKSPRLFMIEKARARTWPGCSAISSASLTGS
jgi:hypothetical protein